MTFLDLVSEKQLTLYKISTMCGLPKTTLHDISSGKSDLLNCTGKTLLDISKALGVSIEDLLILEREDKKEQFPLFLNKSIKNLRKAIRTNSSLIDCYYDELASSINVAEVDGYITKEIANKLRMRYL